MKKVKAPSRITEEDKLILEMRMSEIAAKLMQPNLKPTEKPCSNKIIKKLSQKDNNLVKLLSFIRAK